MRQCDLLKDDDFQSVQIGVPEKLADWAQTHGILLNAVSYCLLFKR